MEPDDAIGDDEPQAPVLPPDDRLWRHPSEVAAHGPPHDGTTASRGPSRPWMLALLAAATSAVLTMGTVAVVGGFESRVRTVPVVERLALPAGSLSTTAGAATASVTALADSLRPAVVGLLAQRDSRSRRGSGVLFRSDGHVLTNAHVVDGAETVVVKTSDGVRAEARLIGIDPGTDLAVVKVDEWASVATAPLGTATALEAGQAVMAVGAWAGADGPTPAAVGAVRALGGRLDRATAPALVDLIMTDTPIAAAWSGGALVDDRGAVVGIITSPATPAPGTTGVGFATPIDYARAVADQLVTTGRVVAPWMGIEGGDLDAGTAAAMGMEGGAVVKQVRAQSPAQRAGLAPNDVIASVDGVPVLSMVALRIVLRSHRPGDLVHLTVVRQDAHRAVEVTLAERPAGG